MPSDFAEIQAEAARRWQALTAADRPWLRVGTALCGQAAGAEETAAALESALQQRGIAAPVSRVGCLGLCFAEPLVDVLLPGQPRIFYDRVTPELAAEIVDSHIVQGRPLADRVLGCLYPETDAAAADAATNAGGNGSLPDLNRHPMRAREQRIALRNAGHIDPLDIYQYIANGGYRALHQAVTAMEPPEVLEQVNVSGLRGRGGAAFPAATKWRFLAGSNAPDKYILCNCEEGDPGAFNDKGILESDPHTVVEGILLAGYATGANYGYIFIRHGHDGPIERARAAVAQAYDLGLLGANIFGSSFSFDLEVALTGDSYVSGEETALMEAIEGSRAMPRYRPPFPAQVGVFGKPTNINNVKTLAYVPEIIAKGGEWFAGIGHERSTGTAILCLSGALNYTGMVEVPMGLNLREALYEMAGGAPGGRELKFIQTGGPLGGVLGMAAADLALDFEVFRDAGAILGSGGIIAAADDACVVDLTRVLIAFCQYESCGKCFPCRMGMSHLLETLERICRLEGGPEDLALMRSVGENMQAGSLCGHGQLGFNPVSSALRYFPEEFAVHINEKRCPVGRCREPRFSPGLSRR